MIVIISSILRLISLPFRFSKIQQFLWCQFLKIIKFSCRFIDSSWSNLILCIEKWIEFICASIQLIHSTSIRNLLHSLIFQVYMLWMRSKNKSWEMIWNNICGIVCPYTRFLIMDTFSYYIRFIMIKLRLIFSFFSWLLV